MGMVLMSVCDRTGGRGLVFGRVNGRGETCQRWHFVRGVLCHEETSISKSVDTWLTRQGVFGERKIPNSLIFRVRDF